MDEREMREALREAAEYMTPSDLCKRRIDRRLDQMTAGKTGGKIYMRKMAKIAVIAVACLTFGSVAVYGAGKIVGVSLSSSSAYDYRKYGDMEKAEEKFGENFSAPESFTNGYVFDGITLVDEADTDDAGNQYDKRTAVSIVYKNANQEKIELMVEHPTASVGKLADQPHQEEREAENGTYYYSRVENLFVPADYKPSEEESRRAQSDPFFNIGYGADDVTTQYSSSVTFESGDVRYMLSGMDTPLSSDDMFSMAAEVMK